MAGAISKALGMGPMSEDSGPPSILEDVDAMDAKASAAAPDAEVMAMEAFDAATTPEDRVAAFRTLLEACGGY